MLPDSVETFRADRTVRESIVVAENAAPGPIDPTTTACARARQETVYDSGDRTFILPIGSLS